jgi:hypothetical protein
MREKKNSDRVYSETEGKRPHGRPGIHGRIILKWILKWQNRRAWTVFIWLRTEVSVRLLWE